MSFKKALSVAAAFTALSDLTGCAGIETMTQTRNYNVPVPILRGAPENVIVEECTKYANAVVPSPKWDAAKEILIDTAIGATGGTALGAIFGKTKEGAMAGGTVGAAYGAFNRFTKDSPQDQALKHCINVNGVVIPTQPTNQYQQQQIQQFDQPLNQQQKYYPKLR